MQRHFQRVPRPYVYESALTEKEDEQQSEAACVSMRTGQMELGDQEGGKRGDAASDTWHMSYPS